MAKRPAARPSNNERAERDLNVEINAAVAATEAEIVDSVFGDDPLDLDGDADLEEMGDGLEGDDVDEDDEADAPPPAKRQRQQQETDEDDEDEDTDEDEESDEDEEDVDDDDEQDDQRQPVAARGRDGQRPAIPPARLREEAEGRRNAETELEQVRREAAELRGQIQTLTTMVQGRPAQQQAEQRQQEPPPKPDPYTQPDEYEAWQQAEIDRKIAAGVQQGLRTYQATSQKDLEDRANESFAALAEDPEQSFEFTAAHRAFTKQPVNAVSARAARQILQAPDPGEALMSWWENNGAEEFREQALESLSARLGIDPASLPRQQQGRRNEQRGARSGNDDRNRDQPRGGQGRHEIRGAQRPGMRSLNGARGGMRQQIDPRGVDDSDGSVFDYVMS